MKPTRTSLLLHPAFILSVFVLLLNDAYWKSVYHNELTGKLSDAAGMIVLPVFLREFFPKASKGWLLSISAVFFIWWKLPVSEPAIHFLNTVLQLSLYRTIDSTDLLVLPLLVIAYHLRPVSVSTASTKQQFFHYSLAFIALISLCSTSMPYRELSTRPLPSEVFFYEDFTIKKSKEDVLQLLNDKHIFFRQDSIDYYPLINQDRLFYKNMNALDSSIQWKPLPPDSTIYLERYFPKYYLIPVYQSKDIRIQNIKFRISTNKKNTKSTITVQSFQSNYGDDQGMDKVTKEYYKQVFREMFDAKN